jgi:hypothetical protein
VGDRPRRPAHSLGVGSAGEIDVAADAAHLGLRPRPHERTTARGMAFSGRFSSSAMR